MTHFVIRKSLILLLIYTIVIMSCKKNESADLVLSNINIIDVERGIVIENQDVLIEGNKIKSIFPHGNAKVKADRVLEGAEKYVIPGLWDMHAHIRAYSHADNLPMFLLYGVTGIRDLGLTNYNLIKRWRKQIEDDEIVGPRIISSGVIIEGSPPIFRSSVVIPTFQEVVPTIDSLISEEVEIIKVFDNIPKDEYVAILRYCKEKSILTAGHIPADMNQFSASEAGLGSIEHFWGIDKTFREYNSFSYSNEEVDSLARVLVENDTYVCPTLVNSMSTFIGNEIDSTGEVSGSEEDKLKLTPNYFKALWTRIRAELLIANTSADFKRFREMQKMDREIIKKLHDRGVKILAGTDTPNPYVFTGISLHEELEIFVKVGLTPAEALKTATLYPAQYFRRTNTLGNVAKGLTADLVVLDANPLEDITHTQRIHAVIYDGKFLSNNDLKTLKSNQLRILSSNSITDFDQFVYMDVKKFGIDALKLKYPDVKNNDQYNIEKHHLLRLSKTLQEGLEHKEAIKALQWNITLFPEYDRSYVAIGKLYMEQADAENAIFNLKKAIALNSDNREADSLLSSLQRR